jgi:hypothetical protein
VILIPVIRHYQLRFAVASYMAELKAKGEPMDLAQVFRRPCRRRKTEFRSSRTRWPILGVEFSLQT